VVAGEFRGTEALARAFPGWLALNFFAKAG
jgi:hypothetical protein